jgi:hypothetical protein
MTLRSVDERRIVVDLEGAYIMVETRGARSE